MDISAVTGFLACPTPVEWIEMAKGPDVEALLLQDHANCEKKAAGTALNLLFRYSERTDLQLKLAQLAREELLHYQQVMELMQKRGHAYRHLSASRYASGMRKEVRTGEPGYLVDLLIVGAFVEARSCERFAALAPHLDEELGRYYRYLLKSESRHFEDYLALARKYSPDPIDDRIEAIRACEASLISTPDTEFRFHSGVPVVSVTAVA